MKYYLIYKITNINNNKIYIGKHITEKINDDYYGSGKILLKSIKKYGIDNFKKEILYIFDNADEMNDMEAEIVNQEFIDRKDTYNLKLGGTGDWSYINNNEELRIKKNKKAAKKMHEVIWADKEFRKRNRKRTSEMFKKFHKNGVISQYDWSGKHHSEETKKKMSEAKKGKYNGKNNSQYGTCWVTNYKLKIKKRINKKDLQKYLDNGYVKGTCFNFDNYDDYGNSLKEKEKRVKKEQVKNNKKENIINELLPLWKRYKSGESMVSIIKDVDIKKSTLYSRFKVYKDELNKRT